MLPTRVVLRTWSQIGFALLLATARSHAAPDGPVVRFALETSADDRVCVSEGAVRAAVTTRLGRDPFRNDASDLLRVTLDPEAARIERVAASGDARGERSLELHTDDCGELLDTLALSIAIAIDPFAVPGEPVEVVVVAPRAVASPSTAASPGVEAWCAAGVLGAVGAQPAPSAGVTLQLGGRRGALVLALEGRATWPGTRATEQGEIRVASSSAIALACVVVHGPRLCVLGGVERLRGQGRGYTESRSAALSVPVGGGRLAWPWHLGPAHVVPHVDVHVRAARASFEVDHMAIWHASRVNASVGVAVELTFY